MPKRIDFVEVGTRNNHLEIIDSAARAYNEAALKYHKEYAHLNIIDNGDSSSD